MEERLREELSNMVDEEFFELKRNMDISMDLRDLMRGEQPFTEQEIMKKLDVTSYDLMYIFNGAYEFTTKHMGIIDAMKEEWEMFNADYDDDEAETDPKETLEDIADREFGIPSILNYGIFSDMMDHTEDDEILEINPPRHMSAAELAELENDDKRDIEDNKHDKPETIEEIGKRIYEEHQAKLKKEQEENKEEKKEEDNQIDPDPSLITFY